MLQLTRKAVVHSLPAGTAEESRWDHPSDGLRVVKLTLYFQGVK
jgi:hypothetical protein